jgi:hypothetical protein
MMEKVVLSKDVAEAIERWLTTRTKEELLKLHAEDDCGWIMVYESLIGVPLMTLASALVNGYEVEATPEEKIKNVYDCYSCDTRYDIGVRYGIRRTLELLGKPIPGVNA